MKNEILQKAFLVTRLLTQIVFLLVGILLTFLYICLLTILTPIYIYRFILSKTSKYFNPSLGKMVTARGQFFAAEDFTSGKPSRAAIVMTSGLTGHLSVEEVKRLVLKDLVNLKASKISDEPKYPELQQYITTWMGFRFWKPEENFNIDDHVKLYQTQTNTLTAEGLREFIEKMINHPFQRKKSPWEIYVAYNYFDPTFSSEPMTMFTIRTHHCLADGYGLLHTFLANLGTLPPSATPKYHYRPTWRHLLFQISFPLRVFYEVSRFAKMSVQNHPWKVPDANKKWKQIYWKSQPIPLKKIKVIKNHFNVSFSSVLQAAYTAASRRSLLENCGESSEMNSVPCVMIMPLPNHPKKLRNYATGAYINLPTKHSDRVIRLQECEKEINYAKRSTSPFLGKYLVVLGGSLTTGLTPLLLTNRSFPVGISNFPIGTSKCEIVGRKVMHVSLGAGGQAGVAGMNYFVYTYDDYLEFSAIAECSVMTHDGLKKLVESIVDEIDSLYSLSIS